MVPLTFYPRTEERINIYSHLAGLLLSISGLALLVTYASLYGTLWQIISSAIYGSSLVVLYLSSTLYHSARNKTLRQRLNVMDHAAIYVLIAGTYTPFALVTLHGIPGWVMFGLIWGLALTGIILKVFYTGRYNKISTISYVLMGWAILPFLHLMLQALPLAAFLLILSGGLAYTIGAALYMATKLPYNHAIFHFLVLAGSILHFICIFLYVA